MRKSHSMTLISLTCLSLFLPLLACTSTGTPADESLSLSSEDESGAQSGAKSQAGDGSVASPLEEESAIVDQIAPDSGPPAPADAESSDYIDPNDVGLTPGAAVLGGRPGEIDEHYEPVTPDLLPEPAPKSKTRATSKKTHKAQANSGPIDGSDTAGLQSESALSDPTSRVAEVSVLFNNGSTTLPKKYLAKLTEVAHQLQADRKLKVVLSSSADGKGNLKRSRALALKRAQTIKSHLLKNGVKPSQVRIEASKQVLASHAKLAQLRKIDVFVK